MSCRPFNQGPERQRGAALVIALMVFGLCAALVVAMQRDFTLFLQQGANTLLAEQAHSYLRGAEDLAALALEVDARLDSAAGRQRDDLSEVWAQPPQPYPLEDGSILRGALEDLQGRFNLNNLRGACSREEGAAAGASRFSAEQQIFIRLLQTFEEPALGRQEAIGVSESLCDWLDGDQVPRSAGAEDTYYYGQTPAYRAANRALASVSELRAVANVSPELYRALAPWVTAWPQEGSKLNIHTAPLQVLRALNADNELAPLREDEVLRLLETREQTGYADVEAFLQDPVFADRTTSVLATVLGEASGYFLLRATLEVAERKMHLYSVLRRDEQRVEALVRSAGEL